MMKNLVTILFAGLLFVGCTKTTDNTTTTCKDGTLHFVNRSINPYSIMIDDKDSIQIAGHGTVDKTLFNGTYYVKATQASGYKVNPVVKEYHVTVKGCDYLQVEIPISPYDSVK